MHTSTPGSRLLAFHRRHGLGGHLAGPSQSAPPPPPAWPTPPVSAAPDEAARIDWVTLLFVVVCLLTAYTGWLAFSGPGAMPEAREAAEVSR